MQRGFQEQEWVGGPTAAEPPTLYSQTKGGLTSSPLILVRVATTLDGWQVAMRLVSTPSPPFPFPLPAEHQQQQQHRPLKTRGQRHQATIAFASQPTQLPKGVCRNASPPPQNGTLQLCLEPPSLPPSPFPFAASSHHALL
ncbi:unnamed protein product [Musa acuminata subsp. burmannicoides]